MGAFNKFLNYAFLAVVVVFVGVVFFWSAFGGNDKPNMSRAVTYEVLHGSETESVDGRRLAYVNIAIPTYQENTPDQYAQTVMKAAWELQGKFKKELSDHPAKVFMVQFTPVEGVILATAIFAVDKKGWDGKSDCEWQVWTLSSTLPPIEHFQTSKLWSEMRDDYQIPNPELQDETLEARGILVDDTITDEKALREAIAEQLHIPFEMVRLPMVTMGEYLSQ